MAGFSHPKVKEVRIMAAASAWRSPTRLSPGYQQFAYQRGVFSRPFLRYLYAMVPYIITEEQLVQVLDTMKAWFAQMPEE